MDIVVRTPHGDADVSVVWRDRSVTLGDVIEVITGQAVPRLALVDGRAVDCSTPLDEIDLLVGSLVTTEPSMPVSVSGADVDIVQIAGHGAGRVARLAPGRYRIGPGRRTAADELSPAAVEQPAIEVEVEPSTTVSEVTIVPVGAGVALDGEEITSATPWRDGTVSVDGRVFRLEAPAIDDHETALPRPGPDGTVAFSRPPRDHLRGPRFPVIDAVRDATSAAPTLWARRPDHPDAFSLPFGVVFEPTGEVQVSTATIDLADDRAIAVAGPERFRSALVRTLLVEATTLHGPADLDVVVMTSPDRLTDWDWAKWLPHLRPHGTPAIWSTERDITRWAQSVGSSAVDPSARSIASHLTVVVLDDVNLWSRRDSPLQAVVSDPPGALRLIALCDDATRAPAVCTSIVSPSGNGRAHLHSFVRASDVEEIHASLTEVAVAARVARALAPLADVDLPLHPGGAAIADDVELVDLLGVGDAADVVARWTSTERRSAVAVGRRDQQPVSVEVADDVTVVLGSTMGDAFDVAATSLLGQCADRSPDALWVVPLVVNDPERADLLGRLPHACEPHDSATPIDAGRVLARVRAVLAAGPDRVLVVVEDSHSAPASLTRALIDTLVDGVHETSGVSLMVITNRADTPHAAVADTFIRVWRDHPDGHGTLRRTAALTERHSRPGEPFAPIPPNAAAQPGLDIAAMVIGRPLTPLERRVEQRHARSNGSPNPTFDRAVTVLRDADRTHSQTARPRRVVVTAPLPNRLDLESWFGATPGDAVPLGLVDDPAAVEPQPCWWAPGDGSVFAFGSRRSGVEQVLATITLGLLDRFAPDDVRLVVLESSAQRRRALNDTDHRAVVRAADRPDEVAATLDEIQAEVDRAALPADPDAGLRPRLVVVVADLTRLRQNARDVARIDTVLAAAGPAGSHVDVIAAASDLSEAGAFATAAASRLVGASSDRDQLSTLGIDESADLDGTVGRCRRLPGGDLVQLAMPDALMEILLARRSTGGPAR